MINFIPPKLKPMAPYQEGSYNPYGTSDMPTVRDDPTTNPDYQPSHQMFDELVAGINNFPQRDTGQSKWRQLGAALMGMGAGSSAQAVSGGQPIGFKYDPMKAQQASDRFMYPNYYKQMEDYEPKMKLLQEAANDEEQQNMQKRILLDNITNRRIQQQKADEQASHNDALERQADARIADSENKTKAAMQRAQAYAESVKGGSLQFTDSGQAYMVYKDGSSKPIDLSLQSPEDLARIKNDLATARQVTVAKVRGQEARNTKATPSGGTNPNGMSPSQQNALVEKRAKQAISEHPEWKDYIQFDPSTHKFVQITVPKKNGDVKTAMQVRGYIYGDESGQVTQSPKGLREAAIDQLRKQGKSTDEENIQAAMKLIQAAMDKKGK